MGRKVRMRLSRARHAAVPAGSLAVLAAVVGPGLLAGLSDDDPAGITTYSILGARIVKAPAKIVNGEPTAMLAEGAHLMGGEDGTVTANLKPGNYELVCHMPGHYAAGQHIAFKVT